MPWQGAGQDQGRAHHAWPAGPPPCPYHPRFHPPTHLVPLQVSRDHPAEAPQHVQLTCSGDAAAAVAGGHLSNMRCAELGAANWGANGCPASSQAPQPRRPAGCAGWGSRHRLPAQGRSRPGSPCLRGRCAACCPTPPGCPAPDCRWTPARGQACNVDDAGWVGQKGGHVRAGRHARVDASCGRVLHSRLQGLGSAMLCLHQRVPGLYHSRCWLHTCLQRGTQALWPPKRRRAPATRRPRQAHHGRRCIEACERRPGHKLGGLEPGVLLRVVHHDDCRGGGSRKGRQGRQGVGPEHQQRTKRAAFPAAGLPTIRSMLQPPQQQCCLALVGAGLRVLTVARGGAVAGVEPQRARAALRQRDARHRHMQRLFQDIQRAFEPLLYGAGPAGGVGSRGLVWAARGGAGVWLPEEQ